MMTPHVGSQSQRSPAARAAAALVLLALVLGGCVGMVRVKRPMAFFDTAHPKIVRVTHSNGNRFIMVGAHLDHDTLMGFVQQPSGIHEFRELSLGDVSKLEAELRSPTKTGVAIGIGLAGFTTAWFLLYRQAAKQGTSQFCVEGLYSAGVPCD